CLRRDVVASTVSAPPSDRAADRYNQAVSLHVEGAIDDAIRRYRDVLAIAPEHVDARYNLALALASQGEHAEVAASFRCVLRHRPDFAEARSDPALVLASHGELDEAIDCFRAALDVARCSLGKLALRGQRECQVIA